MSGWGALQDDGGADDAGRPMLGAFPLNAQRARLLLCAGAALTPMCMAGWAGLGTMCGLDPEADPCHAAAAQHACRPVRGMD